MKEEEKENRLLIYGLYVKGIEAIKHFDTIQSDYRALTSKILLGTFAVLGFVFSEKDHLIPFDRIWTVILVCFLSLIAITSICFIDLVFQERLLIANFVEVLNLERKYLWLPKIHHNMVHKNRHHSAPKRKVIYYCGCGNSLIIILSLSILSTIKQYPLTHILLTSVACLLLFIIYNFFILKITGEPSRLITKTWMSPEHRRE